jgi:hypothetical protein
MTPLPWEEQVLPILFCRGYVTTYHRLYGAGTFISCLSTGSRHSSIADRVPKDFWQIYHPYARFQGEGFLALSYVLSALPWIGFVDVFRETQDDIWIAQSSRRIGVIWWWGDPPLYIGREIEAGRMVSLKELIIPSLLRMLEQERQMYLVGVHNKSLRELAVLTLSMFIEEFRRQSGISCSWGSTDKQLWLEIAVCPFCLGELAICNIFHGIVDGFLMWLQGTFISTYRTFIQINSNESTSHHIVFDIV